MALILTFAQIEPKPAWASSGGEAFPDFYKGGLRLMHTLEFDMDKRQEVYELVWELMDQTDNLKAYLQGPLTLDRLKVIEMEVSPITLSWDIWLRSDQVGPLTKSLETIGVELKPTSELLDENRPLNRNIAHHEAYKYIANLSLVILDLLKMPVEKRLSADKLLDSVASDWAHRKKTSLWETEDESMLVSSTDEVATYLIKVYYEVAEQLVYRPVDQVPVSFETGVFPEVAVKLIKSEGDFLGLIKNFDADFINYYELLQNPEFGLPTLSLVRLILMQKLRSFANYISQTQVMSLEVFREYVSSRVMMAPHIQSLIPIAPQVIPEMVQFNNFFLSEMAPALRGHATLALIASLHQLDPERPIEARDDMITYYHQHYPKMLAQTGGRRYMMVYHGSGLKPDWLDYTWVSQLVDSYFSYYGVKPPSPPVAQSLEAAQGAFVALHGNHCNIVLGGAILH